MFRLGYIAQELRRRRGRALLTALGLGLGIALVVAVTSLSSGLDRAQSRVFAPLAGVGTDLLVSRPIELGDGKGGQGGLAAFATLPASEQKALRDENQDAFVDPADLGSPGATFTADSFLPATQLTFPEAAATALRSVPQIADVGRVLTVLLVHAEGKVPQQRGAGFQGGDIQIATATVAGVEAGRPDIGLITPAQVTRGRFLNARAQRREVVLAESYAARLKLRLGSTLKLDKKAFRVVGLARPPIGTQTADIYVRLPVLQRVANRKARVNLLLVRARKATDVPALSKTVERFIPGIVASSSKDLAASVQGSLVGADNLRDRLATLLAIVALVASVGIAALLVLSSVAKRTRELGTLRALGWSRRRVVALVLGESAALGLVGAALGTGLGIAAAALVARIVPPLKAKAAQALDFSSIFGAGGTKPSTASIPLEAPVDASLVLLAVGLAIGAGLLAGGAGAIRAARPLPADVHRSFRQGDRTVTALDGVSLEIGSGEHVAVTGASGSGKTTLLQLLGALDRPSHGELRFEGRPLSGLGDRDLTGLRLHRLGFVFQQFNLIPTLSARANVEAALDPLRLRARERRRRATERLEDVGLGDRAGHLPSQLSGGEQQRVAIARALSTEPAVVLADEPTGNLDRVSADAVASLLDSLAGDHGRTVVVVTHDAEIAARAPRVVRLEDGRVVEDVTGAGVVGLRAVELPVGDLDAATEWYTQALGARPAAVGLHLTLGRGGVTVTLDALRAADRPELRDPWGNTVRLQTRR